MEIDIRGNVPDRITAIKFADKDYGDYDFYIRPGYNGYIIICDQDGDEAGFHWESIDDLIKALQKAKEIWS
ncbi:MAG: hypothetical protein CMF22_10500 [Idiomarinaceae bacterium]|nr:hypothetical protein [Idiomarinaceae bacterium]MBG23870.1 hypothetical protein [Idiomarinaceae bacterium]|tara:strand:- start:8377 stop:8589 length:213 start_codon:yes stop_codon:yes gene_type:complete